MIGRHHAREWLEANFPEEMRFPARRLNFDQAMGGHKKLY